MLKDKQTDAFTLILEGRVEVKVGKEGLQYEAGPFGYFAVPALMLSMSQYLYHSNLVTLHVMKRCVDHNRAQLDILSSLKSCLQVVKMKVAISCLITR